MAVQTSTVVGKFGNFSPEPQPARVGGRGVAVRCRRHLLESSLAFAEHAAWLVHVAPKRRQLSFFPWRWGAELGNEEPIAKICGFCKFGWVQILIPDPPLTPIARPATNR